MKKCSVCKENKLNSEYHRKGRGLKANCKSCQKKIHKAHYEVNKTKILKKVKQREKLVKQQLKDIVNKLKEAPCTDCKNQYIPFAMDFDHRSNTAKIDDVSNLVRKGRSVKTVLNEISKCDLVCATCHRIRTFRRLTAPV